MAVDKIPLWKPRTVGIDNPVEEVRWWFWDDDALEVHVSLAKRCKCFFASDRWLVLKKSSNVIQAGYKQWRKLTMNGYDSRGWIWLEARHSGNASYPSSVITPFHHCSTFQPPTGENKAPQGFCAAVGYSMLQRKFVGDIGFVDMYRQVWWGITTRGPARNGAWDVLYEHQSMMSEEIPFVHVLIGCTEAQVDAFDGCWIKFWL